jgi:hypothetical protein
LYSYYVTAVDQDDEESAPSRTVSLIPRDIDIHNDSMAGLTPATDSTNASVTPHFSWDSVPGAESYAILLQYEEPGNDRPMVWIFRTTATNLFYNNTTGYTYLYGADRLENNTRNRFQMVAINSSNTVFTWGQSYFTTEF